MSDGGVSGGLGPALFVGLSIYVFVAGGDDGTGPNPARTMDMDSAQITSLFPRTGMPMSIIGSIDPPRLGAADKARPPRPPADLRERLALYQQPSVPAQPVTVPHAPLAELVLVTAPDALPTAALWPRKPVPRLAFVPLIVVSPRAALPLPDKLAAPPPPEAPPGPGLEVAAYDPAPYPEPPHRAQMSVAKQADQPKDDLVAPLSITVTITGNAVFLRAAPDVLAEPLGQFDAGSEAELLDVEGDWSRINFPFEDPPLTGWMFSTFLSVESGS